MFSARLILVSAALLAGLGVALGAFGSHALSHLPANRQASWETAVLYQLFHALALLALGACQLALPELRLARPAVLLIGGTLVFSGSLYALVLLERPILGAITPLGGVALLAGWSWLAWHFWLRLPS